MLLSVKVKATVHVIVTTLIKFKTMKYKMKLREAVHILKYKESYEKDSIQKAQQRIDEETKNK